MAHAHLEHHIALLTHLRSILQAVGEAEQIAEQSHELFLERFDELVAVLANDADPHNGQELICQVFHRYPQIAHLVPRDLLWFFGGDCLHYMPDEEIELYQQLDERRYEAEVNNEPFDWNQEKALLALPDGSSKH